MADGDDPVAACYRFEIGICDDQALHEGSMFASRLLVIVPIAAGCAFTLRLVRAERSGDEAAHAGAMRVYRG